MTTTLHSSETRTLNILPTKYEGSTFFCKNGERHREIIGPPPREIKFMEIEQGEGYADANSPTQT